MRKILREKREGEVWLPVILENPGKEVRALRIYLRGMRLSWRTFRELELFHIYGLQWMIKPVKQIALLCVI